MQNVLLRHRSLTLQIKYSQISHWELHAKTLLK